MNQPTGRRAREIALKAMPCHCRYAMSSDAEMAAKISAYPGSAYSDGFLLSSFVCRSLGGGGGGGGGRGGEGAHFPFTIWHIVSQRQWSQQILFPSRGDLWPVLPAFHSVVSWYWRPLSIQSYHGTGTRFPFSRVMVLVPAFHSVVSWYWCPLSIQSSHGTDTWQSHASAVSLLQSGE